MKPDQRVLTKHKNRWGNPCIGIIQEINGDMATVLVMSIGMGIDNETHKIKLSDLKEFEVPDPQEKE